MTETKQTAPHNGQATEKKTRIRKAQTADHFMTSIRHQPLTVKVDLLKHLKTSIDEDRKVLQEQLALIELLAGK